MKIICENCKHQKPSEKRGYVYCYKLKKDIYKKSYCNEFKGIILNNDDTSKSITVEV